MIYSHATLLLRIADRILIQISSKARVDSLWVNVFATVEGREDETLRRLIEALELIKGSDRYRYAMVLRETDRLLADLVPGNISYWIRLLRRCVLDCRFVLKSSPEIIAAEIVRRTTYGRLVRYKVAHSKDLAYRHRVEEVCTAQALAFASKLPNGSGATSWLEAGLLNPPDLANRAIRARFLAGETDIAREFGIPEWLLRALQRRRGRKQTRANRKSAIRH